MNENTSIPNGSHSTSFNYYLGEIHSETTYFIASAEITEFVSKELFCRKLFDEGLLPISKCIFRQPSTIDHKLLMRFLGQLQIDTDEIEGILVVNSLDAEAYLWKTHGQWKILSTLTINIDAKRG